MQGPARWPLTVTCSVAVQRGPSPAITFSVLPRLPCRGELSVLETGGCPPSICSDPGALAGALGRGGG